MENDLSCNLPKYWFEEAADLQIPETDPVKIQKLEDLVDDIDSVTKAVRLCTSQEHFNEVLDFAKKSISSILSFEPIEEQFSASTEVHQPDNENSKQQAPIDFLKTQIEKRKQRKEADRDYEQMVSDIDDDDGDGEDDLVQT